MRPIEEILSPLHHICILIFVSEVVSLSLFVDIYEPKTESCKSLVFYLCFIFPSSYFSFVHIICFGDLSQAYNNFYHSLLFKLSLGSQNFKSILCGCFVQYHNASSPLQLEISNRQDFFFFF